MKFDVVKAGPYCLPNPWILAPMAGVSEQPFREIARALGAGAAPTELVSAKGLIYGQARTRDYLRHGPSEQPFWVQIFGGDVESMAEGAERAVALGAKIIDINMGCPVRKVTKNGAGSSLLSAPGRARDIVAGIIKRCQVPVTVKIRTGWDAHSLNYRDMARALVDGGCAAIAMHARTRAQGYSGHADWSCISSLVDASEVPVIGNGDAFLASDARRMRQQTGCAAVMIGRGALGNPWVFSQLAENHDRVPTPSERRRVVFLHLARHLEHVGDATRAVRRFRPHLMWYARGLTGAAHFRRSVTTLEELSAVEDACDAFFGAAGFGGMTDTEMADDFEVKQALG